VTDSFKVPEKPFWGVPGADFRRGIGDGLIKLYTRHEIRELLKVRAVVEDRVNTCSLSITADHGHYHA
jgi:hypothetical protein